MESGDQATEANRLSFHPRWGTGWETVLDHNDREIRMQFKFLGLRLPLKRRVQFSEVAGVTTVIESRIRVGDRLTDLLPPRHRPVYLRQPYRPALRTLIMVREGKLITLCTFESPHDAKEFERQLTQRIGLSQVPAQPSTPQMATRGGTCRYHPDALAEYKCAGCHQRLCSKCIKRVSGEVYCQTCASRAKLKVKHKEYRLPKDVSESMRQAMQYSPYQFQGDREEGDESDKGTREVQDERMEDEA